MINDSDNGSITPSNRREEGTNKITTWSEQILSGVRKLARVKWILVTCPRPRFYPLRKWTRRTTEGGMIIIWIPWQYTAIISLDIPELGGRVMRNIFRVTLDSFELCTLSNKFRWLLILLLVMDLSMNGKVGYRDKKKRLDICIALNKYFYTWLLSNNLEKHFISEYTCIINQ